ncbi:MAG: hypothetical protein LBG47_07285 [Prevotellaceae bacterium]|nr:hypothetical protein [Prevotellaceae bacterium]
MDKMHSKGAQHVDEASCARGSAYAAFRSSPPSALLFCRLSPAGGSIFLSAGAPATACEG